MLNRIAELEMKVKDIIAEIEEIKNKCKVTKLADLSPGEEFLIANRKFIVLDHTEAGTKVISKDLWVEDIQFGDDRNYKNSSLKKYLEETVLPELITAIGSENIVEHTADSCAVDGKNEFGNFTCKIRPLTFDEVRKYTDYVENKDLGDWWWTCTPWSTEERGWRCSVAVVSPAGFICSLDCVCNNGVRPFCILKSDLFVSVEE